MQSLQTFKKKHSTLICVDSDGCAIDSMTSKHQKAFGPAFVKYWNLQAYCQQALHAWDAVNLYSATRGINRFWGVVHTLRILQAQNIPLPPYTALAEWCTTSPELSEPALQRAIACTLEKQKQTQLQTALEWSQATNLAIQNMPPAQAFSGVQQALAVAATVADIAIVSSANPAAVMEEWQHNTLARYVNCVCTQQDGSKSYCLQQLLLQGYSHTQVIMVGDAPGDLAAATDNQTWFYPITPDNETTCWGNLIESIFVPVVNNSFTPALQEKLLIPYKAKLGL